MESRAGGMRLFTTGTVVIRLKGAEKRGFQIPIHRLYSWPGLLIAHTPGEIEHEEKQVADRSGGVDHARNPDRDFRFISPMGLACLWGSGDSVGGGCAWGAAEEVSALRSPDQTTRIPVGDRWGKEIHLLQMQHAA